MRARAERFGAIVAIEEPPALVSIDRALARRLGIDGGELWSGGEDLDAPLTGPTEVHLAVTARCPAGCTGCYVSAEPDGHEPSFAELVLRLERIAASGAFSVAFGGGEPALRADIGALAWEARRVGLVPTMTTSGLGISERTVGTLDGLAQINVSWDGPGRLYEDVRGFDGSALAERAMEALREAGIPFGVNTVMTRATFSALDAIAREAEERGAVELQLLRYKPSGRGGASYLAMRLSPDQVAAFPAEMRRLSKARSIAIRIDCALVPFLAADPEIRPSDLVAFGVLGCEGGRSLATVDAEGRTRPCSFFDRADDGPDLLTAWRSGSALGAFRAHAADPPEPCAGCEHRRACRGGCRVVAMHLTGDAHAPDPECPRVRAHERSPSTKLSAADS